MRKEQTGRPRPHAADPKPSSSTNTPSIKAGPRRVTHIEAARARARKENPEALAAVEAMYQLRDWNLRWRREFEWDDYRIARAYACGDGRGAA